MTSDHSCCKPSTTVVSLTVLSTVVNEVRRSKPVFHNSRPCVDDDKVEQEACQLLFAARNSCLFTYFIIYLLTYLLYLLSLRKRLCICFGLSWFVCPSVSKIAEKVVTEFAWNFWSSRTLDNNPLDFGVDLDPR